MCQSSCDFNNSRKIRDGWSIVMNSDLISHVYLRLNTWNKLYLKIDQVIFSFCVGVIPQNFICCMEAGIWNKKQL